MAVGEVGDVVGVLQGERSGLGLLGLGLANPSPSPSSSLNLKGERLGLGLASPNPRSSPRPRPNLERELEGERIVEGPEWCHRGGEIGGFGGGSFEDLRQWLGAQWAGFFLGVPSCPEPPGAP